MRALVIAVLATLTGCGARDLRVVPTTVSQSGGTALRIEGDDLAGHGPVAVYVGTQSAKAVVLESRWLVTAISPRTDEVGEVDVRLEFLDGTSEVLTKAVVVEHDEGVVLRPGAP